MVATAKVYGPAVLSLFNAEIDFIDGDVRAILCTSSYGPDQDTHRYRSSVTNELPTAGGYTAGGIALTGKTLTYDPATNAVVLDCDDPGWDPATITARYLVILVDTGNPATSPLIGYVDFGTDVSSYSAMFDYEVASGGTAGILRATVAL